MTTGMQLFEVMYQEGQQASDDDFLPFTIENTNPEWRELQAYVQLYHSNLWRNADFTGIFSPKFELKTHVAISTFKQFLAVNTDADVCFINPFPQLAYYSYNVWMQGEHAHIGLKKVTQDLLDAVGVDWNIAETPRHSYRNLAYSNFWAAKPVFWEQYVGRVLLPIARFLEENPLHFAAKQVLQPTLHTDPAPYLPFIIERLFSTYLSLDNNVKATPFEIPYETIVNEYCMSDYDRIILKYMKSEVEAADHHSERFNQSLIDKMNMVTELWQQHFFDFYQFRAHPHTGRTVGR